MESYLRDFGDSTADEALNRAQELMYQAWDAGDERSAVALTKQAIKTSPLCADAYVLLAELTAKSLIEQRKLYETGMKAGELALGPNGFKENAGHFWGFLETRPYMRARAGLADTIWEQGNQEEAVSHYWGHCIKVPLLSGSCERTGNLCGFIDFIFSKWPEAIWAERRVHVPQVVAGQSDMGPA